MFHVKQFRPLMIRVSNEAYPPPSQNLIHIYLWSNIWFILADDYRCINLEGEVMVETWGNFLADDKQRIAMPSLKSFFPRPQVGVISKHDKVNAVDPRCLQNLIDGRPAV